MPRRFSLSTLFRRRTASTAWIPEVDGIRFLAIASVFLHHLFFRFSIAWAEGGYGPEGVELTLPFRLHTVLANGYKGVFLFFVLSGFILALPFAKWRLRSGEPVPLTDYYLRRLLRIEPPYIIAMLAFFLLWRFVEGDAAPGADHLAASLGYVHGAVFKAPSPINVVAWTLEVEVQFYLIAPLLFTLFFLRSKLIRRLLILALAAGSGTVALYWSPPAFVLFPYLAYFLTGILLADLYADSEGRPAPRRAWLILPAVMLFGIMLAVPLQGAGQYRVLFPFLVGGFFLLIWHSGAIRRLLSLPVLTAIGGMCYSIYLLHYGLMKWLFPHTIHWNIGATVVPNLLLQGVLYTVVVLFLSALFFVAVERPFMGWRRMRKKRTA